MKISHITQKQIPIGEEVIGHDIREGIFNLIKSNFPTFTKDSYVTFSELNQYRRLYPSELIVQENGYWRAWTSM